MPFSQVVCKAGEAKPKPVFSWTLDGKPLTGLETRDEEVKIIVDNVHPIDDEVPKILSYPPPGYGGR